MSHEVQAAGVDVVVGTEMETDHQVFAAGVDVVVVGASGPAGPFVRTASGILRTASGVLRPNTAP